MHSTTVTKNINDITYYHLQLQTQTVTLLWVRPESYKFS